MKTSLLLNDESRPANLMLQNIAPTKTTPRETEAVVGCNCDRWGHPCPNCVEQNVQPKAELRISLPAR
ncbi:MAG TPA: hypothetical protein VGM65_07915 [Candidatus Udaeobacter sp.]